MMQYVRHETEKLQNITDDEINALYEEATLKLCMGKYEEALKYFNRILEISPSSKRALGYKGLTLFKLRRNTEASQCYERVLTAGNNLFS